LRGAERSPRRRGSNPIDETEGLNGYVVPDRNPAAIAEKLSLLVGDSSLRKKMGRESLSHLKKNFTVEKMTEAIEEVYYNVMDRKRRL